MGFDTKIPKEIAKAVEDGGVDFISMHGRTRVGGYKSKVDYSAIKEAKSVINIPLLANGDITTYQKAKEVQKYIGCEGVMIGRGAIGNPWIFYQIKHSLLDIDESIKKEIILEHLKQMYLFYGQRGILIFRKHLHKYSKGKPNATNFRDSINKITDYDELRKIIKEYFS